jgi:hypothetical protein
MRMLTSPTRTPKLRLRGRDRHRVRPRQTAAARTQRAGGPQDAALYTCHCGYMFTAAVTTTVGCPHCGDEQAW